MKDAPQVTDASHLQSFTVNTDET